MLEMENIVKNGVTQPDVVLNERDSFIKKKESGLFDGEDHQERKLMPQINRKTNVNDDILAELYNRY